MLGVLNRVASSSYMPALFRRSANDIEFTPSLFDRTQTKSGTMVRLTYDMILELDAKRPGFIDALVDYEVVAPYPKNGHLHDELKRRFGHTNNSRMVLAIMDDRDAPSDHVATPLSIIYLALGHKLGDTLSEILSQELSCKNGASPTAATAYSAINMAFKDTDPRRIKLSAGIGRRQVEEMRRALKEKCKSLRELGTLSPLIGFEKWLQETTDERDIAALTKTLTRMRRTISLDDLREARRTGGKALFNRQVIGATARAVAVFVMRTKAGRDGADVPLDQAFRLHSSSGGIVAKPLLDDPADPRIRYYYPMNDDLLAKNAERFKLTGMPAMLTGFWNLMTEDAIKRVHEVTHPEGRKAWLGTVLSPAQAVLRRTYLGL